MSDHIRGWNQLFQHIFFYSVVVVFFFVAQTNRTIFALESKANGTGQTETEIKTKRKREKKTLSHIKSISVAVSMCACNWIIDFLVGYQSQRCIDNGFTVMQNVSSISQKPLSGYLIVATTNTEEKKITIDKATTAELVVNKSENRHTKIQQKNGRQKAPRRSLVFVWRPCNGQWPYRQSII